MKNYCSPYCFPSPPPIFSLFLSRFVSACIHVVWKCQRMRKWKSSVHVHARHSISVNRSVNETKLGGNNSRAASTYKAAYIVYPYIIAPNARSNFQLIFSCKHSLCTPTHTHTHKNNSEWHRIRELLQGASRRLFGSNSIQSMITFPNIELNKIDLAECRIVGGRFS